MDIQSQIDALLAPLPADQAARHASELSAGLGLEVRLDSGGGKGKGVFATKSFSAGDLLFKEPPLAAIQNTANREEAWVCEHCFRFIGGLEQQVARQILAAREAAHAEHGSEAASSDSDAAGERGGDAASSQGSGWDDGSDGGDGGLQRQAALAIEEGELEALAAGATRLPLSDSFLLPQPVRCSGGCSEAWYCSSACAEAAWQQYHQLLCVGPEEEDAQPDAGSSDGKGKASGNAGSEEEQHRRAALREFLHHADETNDIFRLAAIVAAQVLLGAQRRLEEEQVQGAGGASGSASGGSVGAGEPSREACWRVLLAAWVPYAAGHKGLWWECTAAPPEAAADMRRLAEDSLELLCAALPSHLLRRFPALLALPVWGSIVGMFELNNLSVFVGSPLRAWLDGLEDLPAEAQAQAYAEAGRFIDALPEELPGCDGNAFYALHSCCNHSCAPNAEAFKADEDTDGSAVIRAVRDIAPGEEILLSYIDEEATLEERREQLADYGFTCACDKCAAEELAAALQLG